MQLPVVTGHNPGALDHRPQGREANSSRGGCSLALHTTWAGGLAALRAELLPWMTYHAAVGVSR